MTTQLSNFKQLRALLYGDLKKIVIESFAVTDMTTTVASAVLFRFESKGSGFHADERP